MTTSSAGGDTADSRGPGPTACRSRWRRAAAAAAAATPAAAAATTTAFVAAGVHTAAAAAAAEAAAVRSPKAVAAKRIAAAAAAAAVRTTAAAAATAVATAAAAGSSSSSTAAPTRTADLCLLLEGKTMLKSIISDPAATLQARAAATLGVSLPFFLCLLVVCAAYGAIAAATLRGCVCVSVCWRLLVRGPLKAAVRRQQPKVALLGASGSGKTCCFLALRNGRATPTVCSLAPNRCELQLSRLASRAAPAAGGGGGAAAAAAAGGEGSGASSGGSLQLPPSAREAAVELIDCPGNQRLRPEALAAAAASSLLIFFVDAADKPALKGAAEFLFDLFCQPKIHERRPPLLLVANKMDMPEARGQRAVVEDLEREIERCRVSRQVTFEGEDAADCFIGREGSRFLFQEDAPCPMEVCCAAVREGDYSRIVNFILEHCA
ncbi:hypothetical protein Efla_001166 [Eimeria flavescens]